LRHIPEFPDSSSLSLTDILDDSYESDLTDEEHERLILMSEHAIAKPLSTEARKVFEAFNSKFDWVEDGVPGPQFNAIAAALRAAVNEVAPEKTIEDIDYVHQSYVDGYKDALYEILIIANELEAQ
jgi:hypothetical protein